MSAYFDLVTNLPYVNCQRCNIGENLYIVSPSIPQSDVGGFICVNCLKELAIFAGFIPQDAHNNLISELNDVIVEQKKQINLIPSLIEKVIDGTNNILADFIVSVASVSSVDNAVQPKGSETNAGQFKDSTGDAEEHVNQLKQNNKSSSKSTK